MGAITKLLTYLFIQIVFNNYDAALREHYS